MIYDTLLFAAVEMLALALFMIITQNQHSSLLDAVRAMVFVIAAGAYFIYSWTNSGHTLAMKTWRIAVFPASGPGRLSARAALLRFVFAWGWVAPGLLLIHALKLVASRDGNRYAALGILAANILAWALSAYLDPDRQFLHDKLAGTRLVLLPARGAKAPA